MTPNQLLEEVKARPMVLLIDDAEQLKGFLKQALGKFEDKAGVILELWQDEATFHLPPHFLYAVGACDSKRRHVTWRNAKGKDDDGNTIDVVELSPTARSSPPFCLYYLANLRDWPEDENLPRECTSLLADYLEALLALQNCERQYALYLTIGMHEAAQNIPSQQELRQRIAELETAMEENKAIVPPASWY